MLVRRLTHSWDLDEGDARLLQSELARQVVTHDDLPAAVRVVAGVDAAYDTHSAHLYAAAVVLDAGTLSVLESATAIAEARFPYVPGLFSFRELPPVAEALEKLHCRPDVVVCDGQGIAHPRRFGLACHLGLLYDLPTIGCAKSRLVGDFEEPGPSRGESSLLVHDGDAVGRVLRTQTGVNPVFVSTGHRVSLVTACEWVLRLAPRFRLPETTRLANRLVNELRHAASQAPPQESQL
jgi:deoxyribonuclease V